MKISLVTDTYLPEVNGVTTVLAVLRAGLAARGHATTVVAPAYPEGGAPDATVLRRPSIPMPAYPQVRLSWPWTRTVAHALAAAAPDVVHVITEGPLGLHGRGWALRHGAALVTSFHTDFPGYAARYFGRWAEPPAWRYLRWFHGPAHHVQTPSDEVASRLRRGRLPQATVWGRGVDTVLFDPARRSAARRAERGHAGRVVVLHVGRLALEKDTDTLVAAFSAARASLGDRAAFVVAGDGPKAGAVRAALPWAHHAGFLPRPVLADLYADADVFVFPSRTETCGLVSLEAMASGLPVITADEGGVLENTRHGSNGLAVPAGDAVAFAAAIEHLAGAVELRARLAEGALAFARARGWDAEIDRLIPLYEAARARRPLTGGSDPWLHAEPSSSPATPTATLR